MRQQSRWSPLGSTRPPRDGFTIVELMLVVAIIGVLAAIAVPHWREAQLKAKRAEIQTNMRGIYDTLTVWHAGDGDVLQGNPNPALASMGGKPRPWHSGVDASTVEAWDTLGWRPDGEVRCSYMFADFGMHGAYYANALCDIDEDGVPAEVFWWGPLFQRELGKIVDFAPLEY